MMIGCVLGDISLQLGDFDISRKVPLEASEKNFALTGLQSIDGGRNRPLAIGSRKKNKLLMNKVAV